MTVIAILVVSLVLIFPFAAVAIVAAGMREWLGPADVAVVLGCKVYPDGTPSPMLVQRLERGLALWQAGFAPMLIVSGDGAAKEGVDETAAMKAWLVHRGVPAEAVVADPGGVNTRATADFTADWLNRRGGTSAIGVSQYFHLPRIRFTLRQAGVAEVYSAPTGGPRRHDLVWIAREVGAWAKYLLWQWRP